MDETYVKVKGQWMYQYRAVDEVNKSMTESDKIKISQKMSVLIKTNMTYILQELIVTIII